MSREYYFYPAEKKNGKYTPALLEKTEEGLEPATCHWINANCVPEEVKDKLEDNRIDARLLEDEFVEYMGLDKNDETDMSMMYIYELSYDFIKNHAGSGMIIGYMPVDTVICANQNDVPLSEYKYELIKPEIYAELPNREQYMRVSFMDYTSLEYICHVLENTIWNLKWYDKEICILMVYSY